MLPPVVVLGSGPRCGKTLVASSVLRLMGTRHIPAVGQRLIDTGCPYDEHHNLVSADGETLREASSVPVPPLVTAPYRVAPDLEPDEALAQAGLVLDFEDLKQVVHDATAFGRVVLELPGGGDTQLIPEMTSLQLALRLEGPVLVVVNPKHMLQAKQMVQQLRDAGRQPIVIPFDDEWFEDGEYIAPAFTAGDDPEVGMYRHLESLPWLESRLDLSAKTETPKESS